AILYECLTGRPPFRSPNVAETLLQVIADEPIPPRRLQPGVPADLETICLKCLRKQPEKRYATAWELADDLGRFLNHEPIRARPVGLPERSWRWCRRHPARAALALAAALVLGAGAWVVAARMQAAEAKAAADRDRIGRKFAETEAKAADARRRQAQALPWLQ